MDPIPFGFSLLKRFPLMDFTAANQPVAAGPGVQTYPFLQLPSLTGIAMNQCWRIVRGFAQFADPAFSGNLRMTDMSLSVADSNGATLHWFGVDHVGNVVGSGPILTIDDSHFFFPTDYAARGGDGHTFQFFIGGSVENTAVGGQNVQVTGVLLIEVYQQNTGHLGYP